MLTGNIAAFWSSLSHLILPSIILGWFTLALVARITRSSMLDVLSQDYICTALERVGGKPCADRTPCERGDPVGHVAGPAFAGLMSGAIMTETIFAWPGIAAMRWMPPPTWITPRYRHHTADCHHLYADQYYGGYSLTRSSIRSTVELIHADPKRSTPRS